MWIKAAILVPNWAVFESIFLSRRQEKGALLGMVAPLFPERPGGGREPPGAAFPIQIKNLECIVHLTPGSAGG